MKTKLTHQQRLGFTLIELLVVIAIILILAAMVFPVLSRAKQAVKKKAAKSEMAHLVSAITQFQTEYRRMPGSKMVFGSLTANSPDFTFGTMLPDSSTINTNVIISTGNSGYQNCNSELMSILCNLNQGPNTNYVLNPRRIPFYQAKLATGVDLPGLGPDGVLRDPWGNPYIITLDLNADNKCQDGFYYWVNKLPGRTDFFIPDVVGIWSFGPDERISTVRNPPAGVDRSTWNPGKYKENKDNVLSWE